MTSTLIEFLRSGIRPRAPGAQDDGAPGRSSGVDGLTVAPEAGGLRVGGVWPAVGYVFHILIIGQSQLLHCKKVRYDLVACIDTVSEYKTIPSTRHVEVSAARGRLSTRGAPLARTEAAP